MDTSTLIDHLERHGTALARNAERAGLSAPVPTCPEWDVRGLLAHTGMVHRWATAHIQDGVGASVDDPETDFAAPADDVVDWFRAGHAALVTALRAASDDLEAATFLANPGPPRHFWARRQAHETAIHGADAAAAIGEVPAIDAAFALDGITELLEGFYGRRGGRLLADPARTLRVAPTDTATTWLVDLQPDRRTITRDGTGAADCTLRGSSADLYLWLWNRKPAAPVVIDGDEAVAEIWSQLARVRWS